LIQNLRLKEAKAKLESAEKELAATKQTVESLKPRATKAKAELNDLMKNTEGLDFAFWTSIQQEKYKFLLEETKCVDDPKMRVEGLEKRIEELQQEIKRLEKEHHNASKLLKQLSVFDGILRNLKGEFADALEAGNIQKALAIQAQWTTESTKRWNLIRAIALAYGYASGYVCNVKMVEIERLASDYVNRPLPDERQIYMLLKEPEKKQQLIKELRGQ